MESGILLDLDGLPVPKLWQANPAKWASLPKSWREQHLDPPPAPPKPERAKRPYQKRFSTDYAVEWGRKQGWKLIERERYDFRTKRHHDLEGECDAIFDDMTDGRVGVQGAGRGERKVHYERFMAWGGPEKAKRRNLRIFYLEFERGNKTPLSVERWA